MLERLVRQVIPIQSHSRKRVESINVERPEIGLRWGRQSRYEFSAENPENNDPDFIVRQADEHVYINGIEVSREYETTNAIVSDGNSIIVENIKNVVFFIGREVKERHETTSKYGTTFIQPIIETIDTYLRFNFPGSASGLRGDELPQETPPIESAYDILERKDYGDQS